MPKMLRLCNCDHALRDTLCTIVCAVLSFGKFYHNGNIYFFDFCREVLDVQFYHTAHAELM
jgi:hypothetical protein